VLTLAGLVRYCRRHGGVSLRRGKLRNGQLQRAPDPDPERLRMRMLPRLASPPPHPDSRSLLHPRL
jgi:hypothetical protein